MAVLAWIGSNWMLLSLVVTGAISVASVIVKWTPSKVDDKYVARAMEIVKAVSLYKKPE